MIELIFKLAIIFQASSIALGVGSSTLAITSFLTAINDGEIDVSERRMLGVIYIALRVSMFGILATTAIITAFDNHFFGSLEIFLYVLLGVLFANAILMTKHLISSKVGPALQAATWYTLGFMMTMYMFDLFIISWPLFISLYLVDIIIALVLVNGIMTYVKKKNKSQ